jgi:hypothetical protein
MARPNSDIDLVLYGDVEAAVVDRLRTLFSESLLAITVDLQAYQAITDPALKQHIDAVMQPLFTQQELLASRVESSGAIGTIPPKTNHPTNPPGNARPIVGWIVMQSALKKRRKA